mgnify:CR=1 FL=1
MCIRDRYQNGFDCQGLWVEIEVEKELGITKANVAEMAAAPTNNPEINRMMGTEGNLGEMLGLDADWAVRVIAVEGNYGEIFENHLGPNTQIGLERGLNAQWTDGGLLYSPPFR